MLTHRSSRFACISRLSMAAAALLILTLGPVTESAAQQRSQAQVQADRKALRQKEDDLMRARFVLSQWLNDNEHFLLDGSVLTDRTGAARLVVQPVQRSDLDAILLTAMVTLDVPRDTLLSAIIEKDRQVREVIRTQRLPEINRRLAAIKNQFETLAPRQDRPVARLIPGGNYSYDGGNGVAEVAVWNNGDIEAGMTWKPDKVGDKYTLKARWNESLSKYKGTGVAEKNHEYPNGDIPSQFKTFTVYLEYLPQRKGILITIEGEDRWRMNQVLLTPM